MKQITVTNQSESFVGEEQILVWMEFLLTFLFRGFLLLAIPVFILAINLL
ncbi:hypothetical protein [Aeribacillus pallidus]|nr:hypothetical protein [Bacillus sp. (in: firmicutes)]